MKFVIRRRPVQITREDILAATKGVEPRIFDGRNKYYVELHRTQYPIKQPVHLATGLDYTRDFNAQDAQRVLTKLGFTVRELPREQEVYTTETPAGVKPPDGWYKFAITLKKGENGFIIASCPALPGCHSQGRTEEEAITNIKEAIRGYIASMKRHGEEVPGIIGVREVEVAV